MKFWLSFWFCPLALINIHCGKDEPVPYSAAKESEPFFTFCSLKADGTLSSSLNETVLAVFYSSDKGAYVSRGGGCIARPLKEVWAAMHTSGGVRWHEARVDGDLQRIADDPHTFAFSQSYRAGPPIVGIHWTMEWFHNVNRGTIENPERVSIYYHKTETGKHLNTWTGRIHLEALGANGTGVGIDNEISGRSINETKAEGCVLDLFSNLESATPNYANFR